MLKASDKDYSYLDEMFKINPLYEADGYKVGHPFMIAPNTTREYWTWIPRSLKYMPPSVKKIMSFFQQAVVRHVHSTFKENFFNRPVEEALEFAEDMAQYLGMPYDASLFVALHNLGYLPITIQALPEGIFTKPNIPHMCGINTVDGYAWLGLFLETYISKLSWQAPTAATIAFEFKKNAIEWVTKTDSENLWLTDYMCHDFHSRGGNPFTSIAVGLGHAVANRGSDTLNVIPASRYYYDIKKGEVVINSVNASEHSVTCTGIFFYERQLRAGMLDAKIKEYYSFDAPCEGSVEEPDYLAIAEWLNLRNWLKKFPKGILSVVSDTFNLWKLITFILPRLKKEILDREGKLVIRPDSGDPVDITCGNATPTGEVVADKGVVELLWDIFGGDLSKEGYRRLDPHIGMIYGDSINLVRQVAIYSRLADKNFAATNVVLGVGSYTYVYLTRDNAGYAAKGAWFEIKTPAEDGTVHTEQFDIYKDPITDNGTKKSLKGFQFAYYDADGEVALESGVSEEKAFSDANLLRIIYSDGKFYNQVDFNQVRATALSYLTPKPELALA